MLESWSALQSRAQQLSCKGVRGRYAPSPTGSLHLGNLRTALLAWLQVRLADGVLILRMEDLDLPRVKSGSAECLLQDLRWLGLDWDEGPLIGGPVGPYEQSSRDYLYHKAFEQLKLQGLVYPCFCSRKEIASISSAPHGQMPIYPGTCRVHHPILDEPAPRQGRHATWRFRVDDSKVHYRDLLMGPIKQDLALEAGDFAIRRSDQLFAYQLAVVVDDGMMGVTDVLRGADLVDSTPRQIRLFEVLGFPVPRFWHVPLLCGASGQRLAKRYGSESILYYRQQGRDAAWVIGHLASTLGWVPEGTCISAQELLRELSLTQFVDQLQRH